MDGFSYQEVVSLELILDHLDRHPRSGTARPEGKDDLDLHWKEDGESHCCYVQVKKPRARDDGEPNPSPWMLPAIVDDLLLATWRRHAEGTTEQLWVLGDAVDERILSLLAELDNHEAWEEIVFRLARGLAPSVIGHRITEWPTWAGVSGFDDIEAAVRAAGSPADRFVDLHSEVCARLPALLGRVRINPTYGAFEDVQERVSVRLVESTGLSTSVVRDTLRRNLRGYINDVARSRGQTISRPDLEQELRTIWPRMVPVVEPPPLPLTYVRRPALAESCLAAESSAQAIIAPSGSGKTAFASELVETACEQNRLVFYTELRRSTSIRDMLAGLAFRLRRLGHSRPFALVGELDRGDETVLPEITRAVDALPESVTLLIDLADGDASIPAMRELAIVAGALRKGGSLRVIVLGQVDGLAELSDLERERIGVTRFHFPGMSFEEFLQFSVNHKLQTGRAELWPVFDRLAAGR